jgi:hypothetical protein
MTRKTRKRARVVVGTVAFLSFMFLLGITGGCEQESITLGTYVKMAVPTIAVFGICVELSNRI